MSCQQHTFFARSKAQVRRLNGRIKGEENNNNSYNLLLRWLLSKAEKKLVVCKFVALRLRNLLSRTRFANYYVIIQQQQQQQPMKLNQEQNLSPKANKAQLCQFYLQMLVLYFIRLKQTTKRSQS